MVSKTDDRAYVRDEQSHALLNTDTKALARSRAARETVARAGRLEQEVRDLRNRLDALTLVVDKLASVVV